MTGLAGFGPTQNATELVGALENVRHGGTGRLDVGMAWAWRLLSPDWRGHWDMPRYPQGKGKVRKVVMMVTDGRSEAYSTMFPNKDVGDLGSNKASEAHLRQLRRICERMHKQEIEIHMIHVGDRNMAAKPSFEECAKLGNYSHAVDVDEIIAAMQSGISGTGDTVALRQ